MTTTPADSQIIDYLPQLNLGLRLECNPENFIDRFVLAHGLWEPLVVSALSVLVRPGDVCVDVGANAGYISLLMGRFVGPTGRVISFEPNVEVTRKFIRNIGLNPDLELTVELHTVGLSSRDTKMFVSPDTVVGIGNAGLTPSPSESASLEVTVTTLDSFNLEKLDCLKVDVEGMELDVLRGAEQTIQRFRPNIIFETLRNLPPEHHRPIEQYLRSFGYILYSLNHRSGNFTATTYPHYPQDDTFAIHPSRAPATTSRQ